MDQAFDATLERARIAAADLVAAANRVIGLHTIKPEDVRDEVDAATLSRRWTSFASSRTVDEARDDLAFASQARDEVEAISAAATPATAGEGGVVSESAAIGRLLVLATECERRAASLRA